MKRSHHEILKYIYDNDDIGIRELCSLITRKHNDHRDFYALVALLECGYIGFTGPIHTKVDGTINTYEQVRLFQAYSQGDGPQVYDGVSVAGLKSDSYLYVSHKTIEYFNNRSENRRSWFITAALSLICAILSGLIVSHFTVTAIDIVPHTENKEYVCQEILIV